MAKIEFDGIEYDIEALSDAAKATVTSIQFVDAQLQQLNNELAIADTARLAYASALKRELALIT